MISDLSLTPSWHFRRRQAMTLGRWRPQWFLVCISDFFLIKAQGRFGSLSLMPFFFLSFSCWALWSGSVVLNPSSTNVRPWLRCLTSLGCLGGSVDWMSASCFQLRSWSHSGGIEPCVVLCAKRGACLRFSLSPSAPLPCLHTPSVSKIIIKKYT